MVNMIKKPQPPTAMELLAESRFVLRYLIEELYNHRQLLNQILRKEETIMADLTALTAQVTANTDVEASAVVLIQQIAAQLLAASGNQAAVDALAAQLKSSADALAAAVVANTPAA